MKLAAQTFLVMAAAGLLIGVAEAQVPVDDDGNEIGTTYSSETGDDTLVLGNAELEELVGPIALYPDDLLAIVLPASTYPLQIVEAARFLENAKTDNALKPDEDWDDSIVALLNYPEVVELLNEDLDWTWALGEAVVAQQGDVLTAVESFRDRAYAAGNLKTDDYQQVETNDEGIIEITPVEDDVIYVPYYEPERVVVYQTTPVYHYYSRPYPVYYYPYPYGYTHYGVFWGVTTAFRIGWLSDSLHVWHHSYYRHPYYGRSYRDYYWYRRPSIHVHNSIYYGGRDYARRHYRYGDYWRPRYDRRLSRSNQRITRSRYYGNDDQRRYTRSSERRDTVNRSGYTRQPDARNRSGFTAERDRRTSRDAGNRQAERRSGSVQQPGERRRSSEADTGRRSQATANPRTRPSTERNLRRPDANNRNETVRRRSSDTRQQVASVNRRSQAAVNASRSQSSRQVNVRQPQRPTATRRSTERVNAYQPQRQSPARRVETPRRVERAPVRQYSAPRHTERAAPVRSAPQKREAKQSSPRKSTRQRPSEQRRRDR